GDARTAALGPGGRRLRAPPAPPDPARGDPRPRRGAGRGLRADPQGLAPVGAACHGGAMETAVVAGVSAMSEAKRLAGEKAIEYVEDGIVVGSGPGRRSRTSSTRWRGSAIASLAPYPARNRARSACAGTASRCSTSTTPARFRSTWTAPTNATRRNAWSRAAVRP